MAIAEVQFNSLATVGSGTCPASFAALPTAGNAVILPIFVNQSTGTVPTVASITDNQGVGNTYSQIVTSGANGANACAALWWCPAIGTVTSTTIASSSQTVANPGVFTTAAQSLTAGTAVFLTGAAPGGFALNTVYYVLATGLTTTACELALTPGGTAIQCTSSAACTINKAFTVTATVNVGTGEYVLVTMIEASGLSGTVDQSSTGNDGGTAAKTSTQTNASANTNANDLVVCGILTPNSNSPGNLGTPTTGYTSLITTDNTTAFTYTANVAYKIVSATETSSATWTWSAGANSYFGTVLASFKGAGGGTASIAWVS